MSARKLYGVAGKSIPPKDNHPWRMATTRNGVTRYLSREERKLLRGTENEKVKSK